MYRHERTNTIIAWVMGAFSFIVYMMTTAPVVAFWDNGEFIAVGYILGIGHPPGAPVYTLLSRLFGLLPFPNVAQAVNFTSVFASSLAIVFFYLAISRMARRWEGRVSSFMEGLPTYVSGVTACLFIAFSFSYWENALEAEVYGWNILVMAATLWLVLRWSELKGVPRHRSQLYLLFYILALGIGIHMGSLLWAPAYLVFMILFEMDYLGSVMLAVPFAAGFAMISAGLEWWRGGAPLWGTGLLVAGYYALPALWPKEKITRAQRKRKGVWREPGPVVPWGLLAGLAVILLLFIFSTARVKGPIPALYYFLSVITSGAAIGGFVALARVRVFKNPEVPARALLAALILSFLALTVHLYLLIRARLEPAINEAEPKTIETVLEVMRRAQYEPMRFFPRRTNFARQFSIVWGYHAQQFMRPGLMLSWLAPYALILAIWGFFVHLKRDLRTFTMMVIAFFMASVGLLMYLNISDNEVRSREYFWVPSYVGLAIWMGIGSGGIVRWAKSAARPLRLALAGGLIAIALVPLATNYHICDRSGNYVAYHYGMNILNYLEEDAILITNGDNDTFPLWYLQQVEGVRLDVDIVNLSLAQINWHLKQVKQAGVPMTYTYEEIEQLRPHWKRDPQTGELTLVTLRDMAIENIIETNDGERPIYFAVTVSDFMGYYDNLKLEGMVFRLTDETGKHMVDVERTYENIFENYDYTSIVDVEDGWRVVDEVYKTGPTRRLITNYAAGFSRLGWTALQEETGSEEAIRLFTLALKFAPSYGPALNGLVVVYTARLRRPEMALPFAERLVETQPDLIDGWIRLGGVHLVLADEEKKQGNHEQARAHFEESVTAYEHVLSRDPRRYEAYPPLMEAYQQLGMADRINSLWEMWQMYGLGDGEDGAPQLPTQ